MSTTFEMTRRNLMAGVAVGAAVATVGAAGIARADEVAIEEAGVAAASGYDQEADLVVVGAGMGGLCAGVQALQNGVARVTIVEISRWIGGGSSWSAGSIHTGAGGSTEEEFNANTGYLSANNPNAWSGFSSIRDLIAWVADLGLPVQPELGIPVGYMLDANGEATAVDGPHNFFDSFGSLFQELGGTLLTQTAAKEILTDERGRIVGVRCADANGSPLLIGTSQVVLACGGFQNDPGLMQAYVGPNADLAACMGTPYNTGAGIKMTQKLGASLAGDLHTCTGLYTLAQPVKNWASDPTAYEEHDYSLDPYGKYWLFAEYFTHLPSQGIVVNSSGHRFADESRNMYVVLRENLASGISITDADGWQAFRDSSSFTFSNVGEQMDQVLTSEEYGGIFFEADTIEELVEQMNASGYDTCEVNGENLLATIEEYNAAAEAGTAGQLAVPNADAVPIVTPPFHAFAFTPAIFANQGGLAIDDHARVLDCSHQPIPGLYATFPCAGSIMHGYYTGGIAHAGVTGRWAGSAAAEALGVSASVPEESPEAGSIEAVEEVPAE